jgi:hypothetical protein
MSILNRIQFRSNKPRITFEELEERIVLDASLEMMAYDPIFADVEPDGPQKSIEDWGQVTSSQSDSPILASAQDSGPSPELDVVLVSDSVNDLDNLVAAISDEAQIVLYNSTEDNVQTINQALDEVAELSGAKISRLGIMGHGAAGEFTLGTDTIDMNNVESFQGAFKELGANLTEDAQIHLYGCSVASSPEGKALVNQLASYTTADVFASDDNTGGENRDWQLEFASDSSALMSSMLKPDLIASVNTELAAPVISVTAGNDTIWTSPHAYTNFDVSDADGDGIASANITATAAGITGTISTSSGTVAINDAGGLDLAPGTLADLNTELDTLDISPGSTSEGNIELTLTVQDTGGAPNTDTSVSTLYAHENQAPYFPVGQFPHTLGPIAEGATSAIGGGLTWADDMDPDGAGGIDEETQATTYTATLTATASNGTLNDSSGTAGVTLNGDQTVLEYTSSAGDPGPITDVLQGLEFTADASGNNGEVRIEIDDTGSVGLGGAKTTGEGLITIEVSPGNDDPEITGPDSLTSPGNYPAVFSIDTVPITINDPDAGDDPVVITLDCVNGNMTLSGDEGITFIAGDGRYDQFMVFEGTVDAINEALNGSSFTTSPTTPDFYTGPATLNIFSDDQSPGPHNPGNDGTDNHVVNMEFVDPEGWGRWPRV